jgi:hypothetical protein
MLHVWWALQRHYWRFRLKVKREHPGRDSAHNDVVKFAKGEMGKEIWCTRSSPCPQQSELSACWNLPATRSADGEVDVLGTMEPGWVYLRAPSGVTRTL